MSDTNDDQTRAEDLAYIRRMEDERDAALAALAVQSRQREAAEANAEQGWGAAVVDSRRARAAEFALATARADALEEAARITEGAGMVRSSFRMEIAAEIRAAATTEGESHE